MGAVFEIIVGIILAFPVRVDVDPEDAAKNRSVKSTGKPRNSGKFLYRPANRKKMKLASIEARSAKLGKNWDGRWFSAKPTGCARGNVPMRLSAALPPSEALSANMEE